MSRLFTFSRGIFIGVSLMFFFDPRRGRQRRARLSDALAHARRAEQRLLTKAARDASHRARGLVERATHARASRNRTDDPVLEARVRARLGRTVAHPSAIQVTVKNGLLTLRGAVLAREADDVMLMAGRVPGVRGVLDRLDRHDTADVPQLQGPAARGVREQWAPSARVAAVATGGALALYGLLRRGAIGHALAAAGGALAARGALDLPIARMLGHAIGRERVDLHKTMTLHAPPERVFALWTELEGLPRFLQHVRSIKVNPHEPARSTWEVDGPAGYPITFETVTTRVVPDRELSWTTLPDQPIEHSGRVRFEAVPGGTRVDIHLSYRPPGGVIGHAVAHVLGWDPKARIDDDMVRMKALLEDGRTRAHGERVTAQDLVH